MYLNFSKNSLEKTTGGTTDVSVPFWSWSIIFSGKIKILVETQFLNNFFGRQLVKKLDFWWFLMIFNDFRVKFLLRFYIGKNWKKISLQLWPAVTRKLRYRISKFLFSLKIWNFSSRMVYSHRSYSQNSRSPSFLKVNVYFQR